MCVCVGGGGLNSYKGVEPKALCLNIRRTVSDMYISLSIFRAGCAKQLCRYSDFVV